ncbi:YdjC-like protein [compost metagenome]
MIDDLIDLPYHLETDESYADMREDFIRKLHSCKPGITQIVAHPAIVTEELKRLTPHFVKRKLEYQLFNDPAIKQVLHSERLHLFSWREIRDLQRSINRGI